eukprot:COSAG06_NODE_119_length_23111_cov_51.658613_14_plen_55_part_00
MAQTVHFLTWACRSSASLPAVLPETAELAAEISAMSPCANKTRMSSTADVSIDP